MPFEGGSTGGEGALVDTPRLLPTLCPLGGVVPVGGRSTSVSGAQQLLHPLLMWVPLHTFFGPCLGLALACVFPHAIEEAAPTVPSVLGHVMAVPWVLHSKTPLPGRLPIAGLPLCGLPHVAGSPLARS